MKTNTMMKPKILLLGIIFLPSLVMMVGHASSQALGLLIAITPLFIASIIGFLFKLETKIPRRTAKYITATIALFLFIVFYSLCIGTIFQLDQDDVRLFMSCLTFIILIIAAKKLAEYLGRLKQNSTTDPVPFIMVIFVLNALVSLSGIDFFGNASPKPCFLFSEPSHFALAIAPFLVYYVVSRSPFWVLLLVFFSAWAIYIENLTMIMVVIIAYITTINLKKLLLASALVIIVALLSPNLNYYIERIDLSASNDNLSALVFMQGWQNASLSLQQTMGFGVGFQQFGFANESGEVTAKILTITPNNSNLFDGGTMASKLVGEFGIFGALLTLALILRAIKSVIFINNNKYISPLLLLAHCINIGFMVDLLIRGGGYFTQGVFLYLTFCFFTLNERHTEKKNNLTMQQQDQGVQINLQKEVNLIRK